MEPTKNIQSFSFTQASCVNWRSSVFPDRISGDLDNKYPAFKDRHKLIIQKDEQRVPQKDEHGKVQKSPSMSKKPEVT